MKSRILFVVLMLALALSALPLIAQDEADFPRTIIDGQGNELSFDAVPERIVCLYSRCMELLAALEIEPVGAMISDEALATDPFYFAQPNSIELMDWDGDVPNLEQLAALSPDLVLGWDELRPMLEGIAPVYSVVDGQDSWQESHEEIRAFAHLLGREDIAEANIEAALRRLEAYKTLSPADVSMMYGFFYDDSFYYRDGNSGTCNLLKEVALCDWADPEESASWSVQVNDEALLQLNPDVVLLDAYGFEGQSHEEVIATVSARPLWAELDAVKNGRIYVATDAIANMDGMGTVGMSRLLDVYMPILYPEIFPAALSDEEVDAILGEEATSGFSITDATGTSLSFDTAPERVICLYHECIELMSALQLEPIAILAPNWLPDFASDPAYFPQPNSIVKLLPQDSGSWDYEAIAALEPDIVFGADEDRVALEGIAPIYSVSNTYSMTNQDTLDHLMDFGRLFGREAEAEAAIQVFNDRLAAYQSLSPRDQSVLLVAYWDEGAWIYSGASVPCSILNLVAICDWENPEPQPGSWGYSSTVEAVLQLDPDVIILENWTELSNEDALAQLQADALWSEVRAVQNERIFLMENRDAYGLGPVGGARLLDLYMPLIYPEIFPAPLTDEEVQAIVQS